MVVTLLVLSILCVSKECCGHVTTWPGLFWQPHHPTHLSSIYPFTSNCVTSGGDWWKNRANPDQSAKIGTNMLWYILYHIGRVTQAGNKYYPFFEPIFCKKWLNFRKSVLHEIRSLFFHQKMRNIWLLFEKNEPQTKK